jgi:hypothetical protein
LFEDLAHRSALIGGAQQCQPAVVPVPAGKSALLEAALFAGWTNALRPRRKKRLWSGLDWLRTDPATRSGIAPVDPELVIGVRYFGRYRTGAIRNGVLLSVG